jgi:hypothetical protein
VVWELGRNHGLRKEALCATDKIAGTSFEEARAWLRYQMGDLDPPFQLPEATL